MPDHKLALSKLAGGVLFPTDAVHRITIVTVKRLRLVGMFFDLNKCFLLPDGLPGTKRLADTYKAHPDANLLAVGHTDTSGQDDPNLTLSLERADAMTAFLTDNVAAWEAFFGEGKPIEKRWGTKEVQLMLSVLPDGGTPFSAAKRAGSRIRRPPRR